MSGKSNVSGLRVVLGSRVLTWLLVLVTLGAGVIPASAAPPALAAPDVTPSAVETIPQEANTEPVAVVPQRVVGDDVVGRTAYTRTQRNQAQGGYTVTIGARPLHDFDTTSQQFVPWENDLQPADATEAAQGYAYKNRGKSVKVTFGKKAEVSNDRPVLRVSKAEKAVTLTALGANPSSMSASGSKLKYTDAYPDVDIEFTQDNELTKEALIWRKAPVNAQAAQFKYDLDLEGVTAAKQPDNSVLFSDSTGKAVFRIPAPFMVDNSGDPESGYSNNITVTLSQLGSGKVRLEILPDLAWLQDPTRVYPVTLDPTVEQVIYAPDGTTGKDTPLYEANPNTNYGGSATTHVGRRMGDGLRQDTLLEFPELTLLPQDSIVTRATLSLYATVEDSGVPMEVYAATGPWEEGTATWNTPPPTGSYRYASLSSLVPGYNNFYLNGLTRHWVNGTLGNYGVRIQGYGAATGQNTVFVTSDSTDAAHRPQLVVNYVPATRYGTDDLWTYTSHDFSEDTSGGVNVSTGNFTLQHEGGWVDVPGFTVELKHIYSSMDPYGQTLNYDEEGALYGESWSFAENFRLYELADGAVVLRDGSGGNRVYAKNLDNTTTNTRSYFNPPDYSLALTKDLGAVPADPNRVYSLLPDSPAADKMHFDRYGKLTRRENGFGEWLTYVYDTAGRMTDIKDKDQRTVLHLDYLGPGNPGRLSKITELGGRVSTYGYSSGSGDLTTITHEVGTATPKTTTFEYGVAHQLKTVIGPDGIRHPIAYKAQFQWDTAGVTWDWVAEGRATAVSQSTEQAFRGTGSLKVDITNAMSSAVAGIGLYPQPAASWNSNEQELLTYVYVPAGVTLNTRLVLRDSRGVLSYGPWWAVTGGALGQWNEIRLPSARIEPGYKLSKVALQFAPPSTAPAFTGSVWVDHLVVKGVAATVTEVSPDLTITSSFTYNWDARRTTVTTPDETAAPEEAKYDYDRMGQVTAQDVPSIVGEHLTEAEAQAALDYWTDERMDGALPMPVPTVQGEAIPPVTEVETEGPPLCSWGGEAEEATVQQELCSRGSTEPQPFQDPGGDGTQNQWCLDDNVITVEEPHVNEWHQWRCHMYVARDAPLVRPLGAYEKYWGIHGKLFVNSATDGNATCSATIVGTRRTDKATNKGNVEGNHSLLWTAGHCLFKDHKRDAQGRCPRQWPSAHDPGKFVFVPGAYGFRDGIPNNEVKPWGVWTLQDIFAPKWRRHCLPEAVHHDWAGAIVYRYNGPPGDSKNGKTIEQVVGVSARIHFNSKRWTRYWAYGYPTKDNAWYRFGASGKLWVCAAGHSKNMYLGNIEPAMLGIGCRMSIGQSGGGWFPWFNGRTGGPLRSVFSSSFNAHSGERWFGPYLGRAAKSVYLDIRKRTSFKGPVRCTGECSPP